MAVTRIPAPYQGKGRNEMPDADSAVSSGYDQFRVAPSHGGRKIFSTASVFHGKIQHEKRLWDVPNGNFSISVARNYFRPGTLEAGDFASSVTQHRFATQIIAVVDFDLTVVPSDDDFVFIHLQYRTGLFLADPADLTVSWCRGS